MSAFLKTGQLGGIMLYPVIGAIQVRRPGLTDEASEYIIKSVINHLPVVEGSVFASVAPVPGSFAVKYQGPGMPADPPKNEHYWHDSQATAGLYESWLITLSGKAEGKTEADAAKSVQEPFCQILRPMPDCAAGIRQKFPRKLKYKWELSSRLKKGKGKCHTSNI